jgi:ligand-binding SRPBCC domain-containing protein
MRHSFQTEQWVPYPRDQVFAFFSNPANLPPLMPPWQDARVEETEYVPAPASTGFAAGQGSRIMISFRPIPFCPLRLKWEAYIVEFHWNDFFCDEQRRGPFKHFRHCHITRVVTREGITGTVVIDVVEYELPLGLMGEVANVLAVRKQIRALFAHRQRMLPALLSRDGNE